MGGRTGLGVIGILVLLAGCASVPDGTYFPSLTAPDTLKVSHALYKAAVAAGDDPTRYSFALVASPQAQAWSADNATFYVTDGLARMPVHVVEPLLAHEVAHEVLGHLGKKQTLSLSLTAGFAVLGVFVPGASLADLVVNPLVVRAFSRGHELEADARAVEILRAMGYRAPRRALWLALQGANARNGKLREQGGILATHPPTAQRMTALQPLEPPASPLAEALLTQ
ncbi:MAG: M48 family metalloprotease [Candidatus Rokubacteria bacterium]|nr:M48 family metalloprotease [Candidatus Rokubacteria bacterium]